ncbi:MAG: TIM44-like domain-containing protein [Acetobacteraceae bacterium]|nr:TIM44-like domain-containing protein [Acetobacteraceae bacterium]
MRRLMIAALCLAFALAPGLAFAKAGSGLSMGSRGSQTYSAPAPTSSAPYGAAPMQQSITPYGSSGSQPTYGQATRSPFGGFMGGLLTGGLIGMFFGGGLFHHGLFGLLGGLFQLLILFWVIRFVAGMVMGGGARPPMTHAMPGGAAPRPPLHEITIGPADYQAFEQTLYAIQQAWSQHDIATLRLIATPEMVSYFGEQLAEQTSRGVRNIVSDVHLDAGDLSEAWSEEGRDYATVSMRFSMVDVTYDSAGRAVSGVPGQRVASTEFWTFLRVAGGRWVLSAIQQMR